MSTVLYWCCCCTTTSTTKTGTCVHYCCCPGTTTRTIGNVPLFFARPAVPEPPLAHQLKVAAKSDTVACTAPFTERASTDDDAVSFSAPLMAPQLGRRSAAAPVTTPTETLSWFGCFPYSIPLTAPTTTGLFLSHCSGCAPSGTCLCCRC